MRPVEYMRSVAWGESDVWYAHAIRVNDAEILEFARAGIGACHCSCSNMWLSVGKPCDFFGWISTPWDMPAPWPIPWPRPCFAVTIDLERTVAEHNRHAARLAAMA